MSMAEALRPLRGIVDWLKGEPDDLIEPPRQPTAIEDAQGMVELTTRAGLIDRQSPTWNGVARWAATQLIEARAALETADGDRAAALRARCKAMRDLLSAEDRANEPPKVEDFGPDVS